MAAAQQRPGRTQGILRPLPAEGDTRTNYRSIQREARQDPGRLLTDYRGQDIEQAFDATREIRAMPLNISLFADESIGWRVTGRYPEPQEESRPALPGWDSRYDWDSYADPILHPPTGTRSRAGGYRQPPHCNPATALSCQLLGTTRSAPSCRPTRRCQQSHDTQSMIRMRVRQTSLFVAKLQAMFDNPGMARRAQIPSAYAWRHQRSQAREADRLMAFDGN